MPIDREQVITALRTVKDPELYKDLVTLNMVKEVRVEGANVQVHIELTTPGVPMKDVIQRDVEGALKKIGAEGVKVEFSASTPGAGRRRRVRRRGRACKGARNGMCCRR